MLLPARATLWQAGWVQYEMGYVFQMLIIFVVVNLCQWLTKSYFLFLYMIYFGLGLSWPLRVRDERLIFFVWKKCFTFDLWPKPKIPFLKLHFWKEVSLFRYFCAGILMCSAMFHIEPRGGIVTRSKKARTIGIFTWWCWWHHQKGYYFT